MKIWTFPEIVGRGQGQGWNPSSAREVMLFSASLSSLCKRQDFKIQGNII
jgi:hypothetical protein